MTYKGLSEENFKEKFDSDNNWKTEWLRMILKWHLLLTLSLEFIRKLLRFVGKHANICPYDVCLSSLSFIQMPNSYYSKYVLENI